MLVKFDPEKFRKERRKRITQTLLAEKADTTIRYVRDLEHGRKSNPSAAMLYRISSAMGVPMENFLTEYDDE